MEPDFWLERWRRGETGFHQNELNPYLRQFWHTLGIADDAAVFVPLCGKSKDMAWLHDRGHSVWGVEVSPIALEDFFRDSCLQPRVIPVDALTLYTARQYNLFLGDYFDLRQSHLPPIAAVYDRASLVALPPHLRRSYAQHMAALLVPGARVLLISVDYPAQQMAGPPFAVSEQEVRELYSAKFNVRSLMARNVLDNNPRFRDRGVTHLEERVYLLLRNSRNAA